MSNEKRLHSRLERLMAGLGSVAHNGAPKPPPVEPAPARQPGASIDPHGIVPGWTWESDAQGRYTACSGEIATLLGLEPAGLLGQSLTSIALAGAGQASRHELAAALQAQRPLLDLRLDVRTPDGSPRVAVLSAMPLFD